MGVVLKIVTLISLVGAVVTEDGRSARSADPQMSGVLVPRPVQVLGPDQGKYVKPHNDMLFSYRSVGIYFTNQQTQNEFLV